MKEGGERLPGRSWASSAARHRKIKAVIGQLMAAVQTRVGAVGERREDPSWGRSHAGPRGGAGRGGFGSTGYAHAHWCCRCRRGEGSERDGRVRVGVQGESHRASGSRAAREGRLGSLLMPGRGNRAGAGRDGARPAGRVSGSVASTPSVASPEPGQPRPRRGRPQGQGGRLCSGCPYQASPVLEPRPCAEPGKVTERPPRPCGPVTCWFRGSQRHGPGRPSQVPQHLSR